jgi:hypothetical protein
MIQLSKYSVILFINQGIGLGILFSKLIETKLYR